MQEAAATAGLVSSRDPMRQRHESRDPTRQRVRLNWLPDEEFAIVSSGDQVILCEVGCDGKQKGQVGTAFRAKSEVLSVSRCGETDRIMILCRHGGVTLLSCPFLGLCQV